MDKQTNFINIRYIKCYVFTTQPSKRQHKNTYNKDTYQTCSNDNYVFFRHVFFGLIEAATAPEKEALTSQLTLTYSRT